MVPTTARGFCWSIPAGALRTNSRFLAQSAAWIHGLGCMRQPGRLNPLVPAIVPVLWSAWLRGRTSVGVAPDSAILRIERAESQSSEGV